MLEEEVHRWKVGHVPTREQKRSDNVAARGGLVVGASSVGG